MAKKTDTRFDRAHAQQLLPKGFTRTRLRALLGIEKWKATAGAGPGISVAVKWLEDNDYVTYGPFPYTYGSGSGSHSYRVNPPGLAVLGLVRAPYRVSPVPGVPIRKMTEAEEQMRCTGVMHSIEGTLRINSDGAVFFFPSRTGDKINSIIGEE
jgi:hypothetical protein